MFYVVNNFFALVEIHESKFVVDESLHMRTACVFCIYVTFSGDVYRTSTNYCTRLYLNNEVYQICDTVVIYILSACSR